ncbi:MAG: hypothetical protein KIS78_11550 [Labilithrix sp.]|nr:hypothetical protein [Labilithrix sp.]MCW5833032.1 hypothetical protein [Labilithrix sp.]
MVHRTRISNVAVLVLAGAGLSPLTAGCAATEERPRTEDDARQLAPLPACLIELGSRGARTEGVIKSLSEEQLWRAVYPAYDARRRALPADPLACTGRPVLRDAALAGGTASAAIQEGDTSLGSGGDRLKIAWLRSLTFEDGTAGGALALVRAYESTAEVYAVGAFRGRPRTLFGIERIGPEVVVAAQDDGCAGRKAGAPCEAMVTVFRPRFGALDPVATIAQERVSYTVDGEPGVRGRTEYRLASSIQYLDGGIRVLEQVTVRDDLGREVRRAELERAYTFAPDGKMVVDEDSLWSRVAVAAPKTKPPPSN